MSTQVHDVDFTEFIVDMDDEGVFTTNQGDSAGGSQMRTNASAFTVSNVPMPLLETEIQMDTLDPHLKRAADILDARLKTDTFSDHTSIKPYYTLTKDFTFNLPTSQNTILHANTHNVDYGFTDNYGSMDNPPLFNETFQPNTDLILDNTASLPPFHEQTQTLSQLYHHQVYHENLDTLSTSLSEVGAYQNVHSLTPLASQLPKRPYQQSVTPESFVDEFSNHDSTIITLNRHSLVDWPYCHHPRCNRSKNAPVLRKFTRKDNLWKHLRLVHGDIIPKKR